MSTISRTFHGRDVYAPTAASLAKALQTDEVDEFLNDIGSQTTEYRQLKWRSATRLGSCIDGQLMHIDVYGNLITNIPSQWLELGSQVHISIAGKSWSTKLLKSYSAGYAEYQPFIVPSSGGTLEIALTRGNAQAVLLAVVGNELRLSIQ